MAATIQLNQGFTAIIDERDLPLVSSRSWTVLKTHAGNLYATASINGGQVYMHRLIMDAKEGEEIDHEDGNGLNNRRRNLRRTTRTLNHANRRKRAGTSSEFKGVSWHKSTQRWRASVKKHGVTYELGTSKDPVELAKRYDAKARELFGEFARTNFPAPPPVQQQLFGT